eukprot:1138172-Pelagomonas_calceolata.AAC.1
MRKFGNAWCQCIDSRVVGPMVGANLLEQTSVLALSFGLCGGALPFRTGALSLMHAAGLGKRSLSFFQHIDMVKTPTILSSHQFACMFKERWKNRNMYAWHAAACIKERVSHWLPSKRASFLHPGHKDSIRRSLPCCRPPRA